MVSREQHDLPPTVAKGFVSAMKDYTPAPRIGGTNLHAAVHCSPALVAG